MFAYAISYVISPHIQTNKEGFNNITYRLPISKISLWSYIWVEKIEVSMDSGSARANGIFPDLASQVIFSATFQIQNAVEISCWCSSVSEKSSKNNWERSSIYIARMERKSWNEYIHRLIIFWKTKRWRTEHKKTTTQADDFVEDNNIIPSVSQGGVLLLMSI